MEDVVAVRVDFADGSYCYYLTWGRVQDPVDPAPLEELVLDHARRRAAGGGAVRAAVAPTLQDAAGEPWFHECLFAMACEARPRAPLASWRPGWYWRWRAAWVADPVEPRWLRRWRRATDRRMREGRDLWLLGMRPPPS